VVDPALNRGDAEMVSESLRTKCCIAGGGPAGMMLGFLLARAGVDVVVLEKHGDFLRDFRGDTVHPSTLEVMHELGLLDEFLRQPHDRARRLTGFVAGQPVTVADFSRLPVRCPFIAFVPQWEFLDFLADRARQFPGFHLRMNAKANELIVDGDRVTGIRAETANGILEIHADLVVGADGRHSIVRQLAGLSVRDIGAPIDVFWLRLSRRPGDPDQPAGRFDSGRILVMINRSDYWQCGFVIPKGSADEVRRAGLPAFQADIAAIAPFVADRVSDLRSWDDVKLLTVAIDRLRQWYRPGLLCIGDSAHAMSPVGGVGINLAIQDAVAAANLLASPLLRGRVSIADLRKVQLRRELPTRLTQWLQVQVQERVIRRVLRAPRRLSLPLPLRLLQWFPLLRRLPARLIGMGIRPEHVRTADVHQ
jgi:2-polyprenyl-6-methoxyphenol hydroxylase-like FAD-dependent oxidoreductase